MGKWLKISLLVRENTHRTINVLYLFSDENSKIFEKELFGSGEQSENSHRSESVLPSINLIFSYDFFYNSILDKVSSIVFQIDY